MTTTLCIETSSAHCSVALQVNGQVYQQQRLLQRDHNRHLLGMLDELMKTSGIGAADVQLLGFGCGPGSFTGVRIAASVTQAIAFVADAPVVAMPGARVWLASALQARRLPEPPPRLWLTSVASRGQAVYLSLLEIDSSGAPGDGAAVRSDQLLEAPPDWLLDMLADDTARPGNMAVTGQLPAWLPEQLKSLAVPDAAPSAAAMLEYVLDQHGRGASGPAEQALPVYVQGDSPWQKVSA